MLDDVLQVLRGDFGAADRRDFLAAWIGTATERRGERDSVASTSRALQAVDLALRRALDSAPESPSERALAAHLAEVRGLCGRDPERAAERLRMVFHDLARESFASPRLAATAAAEALAELANAHLATGNLDAAEHTLTAALRTLREGVADPRVEARIEMVRADLLAQTSRVAEAGVATHRAARLSRLGGDEGALRRSFQGEER